MIKVIQYIENTNGERAYVGDIIKMDLMVTTGFGNTGEIIAIENDRISFKSQDIWQPISGINDFTIIKRNYWRSIV